ncbi:hypothetical protein [Pseudoclavibacter helvolus]|uniref:Phage tail protein n=1 Tax=Pseudoclavibacter helvolus TaxID=255205 RepID=A0A7W4USA2_9MICO|nr:hypothetical protein [Pseudoclavibacter helvolus]MBB2959503.1 hypothetical protein [Pseudoclavibacter helvolus]
MESLNLGPFSDFHIQFPNDRLVMDGTRMMQPGFNVVEVKGLNDPVPMSSDSQGYAQGHGEFDSEGQYGAREIQVLGYVYDPNMLKLGHWRDRFNGIRADGKYGQMIVDEFGQTRSLSVKRDKGGAFGRLGASRFVEFDLRLKASDPRMFGETQNLGDGIGTSVKVSHDGNFNAHPVIRVTATSAMSDGYVLALRDEATWAVNFGDLRMHALATGSTHEIHMREGIVRRGSTTTGLVAGGGFWSVPPWGDFRIFVVPNGAGAGGLRVELPHTYI